MQSKKKNNSNQALLTDYCVRGRKIIFKPLDMPNNERFTLLEFAKILQSPVCTKFET